MRRSARRAGSLAAVVIAPLLLGVLPLATPATAADGGPEPGTFTGGTVTQTGWWGQSNRQAPETGLAAPPSLPSLAAPKGTLPVTGISGQPERITALQFALKGKPDGTVKSVKLALKESAEDSTNLNASAGTVFACPLTEEFWVGVENGPWDTAPTYDCSLGSVAGKRSDEGVWTFDLTSLATQWLASDSQYAPAVVLVSATDPVEAPDAPQGAPSVPTVPGVPTAPTAPTGPESAGTFQVGFDGLKGIGLVAKTKPPVKTDDDSETDSDDTDDGDGGGLGGGGGFGAVVDAAADLLDAVPAEDLPVTTPDTPTQEPTATGLVPVAAPILSWYDGIGAKALLAVPALLIAYLIMLAMGPGGQPVVGGGRRGVSRALDRMKAEGAARLPGRKSS